MAARTTVKLCAAAVDTARRSTGRVAQRFGTGVLTWPPAGLVVLLYHRVGRRRELEIDLPRARFADQMAELAASRTVVSLDDGLARLADPGAPEESMIAVTFDDGTADFVDVAMPVLAEHRVPVTLYVATDFVEQQRPFPNDGMPVTWAALRDAMSTGLVDLGSHTHTHALLDRADPNTVAAELDRSRALVCERTGAHAWHFAYPKAVPPSGTSDELVRSRFRSAALAGTRVNRYGSDPYRLARSPVQHADGMRWFRRKADGGLALEDQIRGVLNRRRYADTTT
jgi:peptidoglycan/xylan/chitin deacetylase (PgdA/CDA1 family)